MIETYMQGNFVTKTKVLEWPSQVGLSATRDMLGKNDTCMAEEQGSGKAEMACIKVRNEMSWVRLFKPYDTPLVTS